MDMKPCPLCGKEMQDTNIYLCQGLSTLSDICINYIEIKVRGINKYNVIDDWNVFATVAGNEEECYV